MSKIDSLKKKIKYRSEHRCIKEMDLLLGNFVKKYVDTFNQEELLDLYNILEKTMILFLNGIRALQIMGQLQKAM